MTTVPSVTPSAAPAVRRIELSTSFQPAPTVTFTRLCLVEARKLVDTLTGRVLVIVGAVVALLVAAGSVALMATIAASVPPKRPDGTPVELPPIDLATGLGATSSVMTLILAILAILSITSEWGQRTALTTFALEPTRWKTLVAKLTIIAALSVAISIISFGAGAATLAIVQAMGTKVTWDISALAVFGVFLVNFLAGLGGAALGLLFLNAPAALVTYIALPWLLTMASGILGFFEATRSWAPWISNHNAQAALMSGKIAGIAWAHLALGVLLWTIIPLALGTYRWMTKEVKGD